MSDTAHPLLLHTRCSLEIDCFLSPSRAFPSLFLCALMQHGLPSFHFHCQNPTHPLRPSWRNVSSRNPSPYSSSQINVFITVSGKFFMLCLLVCLYNSLNFSYFQAVEMTCKLLNSCIMFSTTTHSTRKLSCVEEKNLGVGKDHIV